MAPNSLHLRMGGIPRNQHGLSLCRDLRNNFMNLGYKRAGGIHISDP